MVHDAGQDSGFLQVADAVGEDSGGDEDEEVTGDGEEELHVDLPRAPVGEPAEDE